MDDLPQPKMDRAQLDALLADLFSDEEAIEHEEFIARRLDEDAQTVAAHFADQGFEFTTPRKNIVDSIPTWFSARVAGKVVYFRFRGDRASLDIGDFSVDVANEQFAQKVERATARVDHVEAQLEIAVQESASGVPSSELRISNLESDLKMSKVHLERLHERRAQELSEASTLPNCVDHTVLREDVTDEPLSSTLAPGKASSLIIEMLEEALAAVQR